MCVCLKERESARVRVRERERARERESERERDINGADGVVAAADHKRMPPIAPCITFSKASHSQKYHILKSQRKSKNPRPKKSSRKRGEKMSVSEKFEKLKDSQVSLPSYVLAIIIEKVQPTSQNFCLY